MAKLYIDEYSKKGLRTLVLGKKRLSDQEYRNWKDEYNVKKRLEYIKKFPTYILISELRKP